MNRDRLPGRHGEPHTDATVAWMVDDIAVRCRAVLDALADGSQTAVGLGGAGMLLREAADDLVSLTEMLGRPAATPPGLDGAFGLAFGAVRDRAT
ncbi:MAG: hypothetical protein HKN44_10955 [Ilumatobacter sp.]|nr:hypothetical protein [Ilumatobacter sp.]